MLASPWLLNLFRWEGELEFSRYVTALWETLVFVWLSWRNFSILVFKKGFSWSRHFCLEGHMWTGTHIMWLPRHCSGGRMWTGIHTMWFLLNLHVLFLNITFLGTPTVLDRSVNPLYIFHSTFEDNKHVQLHSRNLLCCLHLHLPTKSSEFRKERDGKDNTFQRVLCHPEFGLDVLILLKSERSFLHILVLNWFEEARLRASNF